MGNVFAGRYELVDPLGEGGAGVVWRAWDRRNRCYCAAKVLFTMPIAAGEDVPRLTQGPVTVGTPGYAAPEAREGGWDPEPRADLYAAGICALEMLTGLKPDDDADVPGALAQAQRAASVPAELGEVEIFNHPRRFHQDGPSTGLPKLWAPRRGRPAPSRCPDARPQRQRHKSSSSLLPRRALLVTAAGGPQRLRWC